MQTSIRNFLKKEGWFVHKVTSSVSGFPDLEAIRNGAYLHIETKTTTGELSEIQNYRIKELQDNGANVLVCYGYKDFKKQYKEFVK